MALNQKIRLQIISALDDAGIKATAEQLEKLENKVAAAATQTQGLGKQMQSSFNPMEAIMAVAHGNVEGITKAMVNLGMAVKGVTLSVGAMTGIFGGITLAIALVKKLTDAFKSQKSEADIAAESIAKSTKAIADAQKAARESIKNAISGVDEAAKKRNAELEMIEKEVAAEKRLQMETAKRNGDLETAARLQNEITADTKAEAVKRKKNAIADVDAKIKAVESMYGYNSDKTSDDFYDAKAAEKKRRRLNGQLIRLRERLRKEEAGVTSVNPITGTTATVRNEAKIKEIEAEIEALNNAKTSLVTSETSKHEANKKIDELKAQRMDMERDLAVYEKIQVADAIKLETEQRMKAEDELHKQRLANLKDESAAAQSAATAARSRAEKEFQLYKSGNAAATIEAEKKDAEARKQLQRDASRYGGKWRIDELARLYGEGDEKKIDETIQQWRKSKSFTPEVEAMVRAAASDQNATTLEDRVAEIAKNTQGLADKLDELLAMKG